jgi:hypothetical protein
VKCLKQRARSNERWTANKQRDEVRDVQNGQDQTPAAPHPALGQAIENWRRRGFVLRYLDETLAQLTRREAPSWDVIALAGAALGALGLTGWLLRLAWRRWRRWRVVSLTTTPDDEVITLEQRTHRRPDV